MNKEILKALVDKGLSQTDIAKKLHKGKTTVRYWLSKYNLKTARWSVLRNKIARSTKNLAAITKRSSSLSEILREYGLQNKGGNIKTLKKCLKKKGIDFSHIPLGISSNKGRSLPKGKVPLHDVMIEDSTYSRYHLKKRIIESGIIEYKCAKCGIRSEWQGEHIVLILDHINGIPNDHRRKNLRFLCPNCNSQTNTFAGRNR